MNKERSNILIIGTLASGSSALVDMLREYDNINALPREFDNFRRPGFVYDQLSPTTSIDYPSVIDKEIRFVNKKWKLFYRSSAWKIFFSDYFGGILDKEWGKLNKYKNSIINLRHIYLLSELSRHLSSEISFEEKIQLSNKWVQDIGNIYSSKYDFTLFNQALLPWFDTEIWTTVFKPFKLICVHRDPRDQIAEMVKREIVFSPFRNSWLTYGQFNIMSIYGNDRRGRMKFNTDALKKRIILLDQWIKKLGPDQILLIDFEGLSYNYVNYKSQIENFLGLKEDQHKFKKQYFNPDVAIKNSIEIYKNYLTNEEIEDLSDLEAWYNDKIKNTRAEL
jgi:hypothetical protein